MPLLSSLQQAAMALLETGTQLEALQAAEQPLLAAMAQAAGRTPAPARLKVRAC